MPLWTQLAEPVALSISDALTRVLTEQAPEEMQGMIANAGQVMRSIGGALFAMQLGQVVGQLAKEVVSGGDIGIPLIEDGTAALLPQNVAEFGDGLDIPVDQVQLYLAVRELAHARLFRHAKWLRLQLLTRSRRSPRASPSTPTASKNSPRASTRPTRKSFARRWSAAR